MYFLIPKGGEEILSRRARSVDFDPEPVIKNSSRIQQDNTDICDSGNDLLIETGCPNL